MVSVVLNNDCIRNGLFGDATGFGPVLYLCLTQVLGSFVVPRMQASVYGPFSGVGPNYGISLMVLFSVILKRWVCAQYFMMLLVMFLWISRIMPVRGNFDALVVECLAFLQALKVMPSMNCNGFLVELDANPTINAVNHSGLEMAACGNIYASSMWSRELLFLYIFLTLLTRDRKSTRLNSSH